MGQLCDDDCVVILCKQSIDVLKNNKSILRGTRNLKDGLWDISIPNKNKEQHLRANVILPHQSNSVLIHFYHGCCFSPVKSTWLRAIKNGNFVTWPGLTYDMVSKYYPDTSATAKGHLNQERQNLRSTSTPHIIPPSTTNENQTHDDFFPKQVETKRTNKIFCKVLTFEPKSTAYSDLTGKFPYRSSRGNQYIMVHYDYDSNAILQRAVKSRQAADLKNAFTSMVDELTIGGVKPELFILDNEISGELKAALKKYDIEYQLVPPAQHRRNSAERAIQTFKNHFLAGLATLPPNFPMTEWDRLLKQATITLNLLRNARLNPKLSAHAFLHGVFDYNKYPLAPPGTQIVAHEKNTHRRSWDLHGKDAWYVGPAMEHYRCVSAYIPHTGQERICDTVKFLPEKIPFPQVTTQDYLKNAAQEILELLKNPKNLHYHISNHKKSFLTPLQPPHAFCTELPLSQLYLTLSEFLLFHL